MSWAWLVTASRSTTLRSLVSRSTSGRRNALSRPTTSTRDSPRYLGGINMTTAKVSSAPRRAASGSLSASSKASMMRPRASSASSIDLRPVAHRANSSWPK